MNLSAHLFQKVLLGDSGPTWLFGIVSLMAGLLTLVLPETKDTKLPDTLEVTIKLHTECSLKIECFFLIWIIFQPLILVCTGLYAVFPTVPVSLYHQTGKNTSFQGKKHKIYICIYIETLRPWEILHKDQYTPESEAGIWFIYIYIVKENMDNNPSAS